MAGRHGLAAPRGHGLSPLFLIRGYELEDGRLRVRRPGWYSTVALHDIQRVRLDPNGMRWVMKVFGNGGLFCFAGLLYSRSLGFFRAYVTDSRKAVVIETPRRTYVVSPQEPEELLNAIAEQCGLITESNDAPGHSGAFRAV